MMAVTVKDVAKTANLSVGTVSRYLNGHQLKQENQLKIEKAIKQLDFKENYIAKGLKNRKTLTLGIALWSLKDAFVTSVVTYIEQRIERTKYSIILSTYEYSKERLEKKLQFLKERFIDGLILFPQVAQISSLEEYKKEKIPIVLVDEDIEGFLTDKVTTDNFSSAYNATEALIKKNHKNIAIINGRPNSYIGTERSRGFINAMNYYNIPIVEDWVKWANYTSSESYNAVKAIMSNKVKPTAMIITTYELTLGALMALYEMNIKIPEDISIIGFGNFGLSEIARPSLSVIEKPTREIGYTVAELLMKRMNGDYSNFPSIVKIKTKLLLRDSVKAL